MMGTPMNTVWSSNDANKTNTKNIREHSCHLKLTHEHRKTMLPVSHRATEAQSLHRGFLFVFSVQTLCLCGSV